MQATKQNIIQQLQKEILSLQKQKKNDDKVLQTGLAELDQSFPDHTFPLGAVHEFISHTPGDAAATNGFMATLMGPLLAKDKYALWINTKRSIFPPALCQFGIQPQQIIFVDAYRRRDVLWAIEEALKCEAVAVVAGMLGELSFIESRRLQLAVEQSKVTGFIHRYKPARENTVACVTRWKITSVCSDSGPLPGVGFARWQIELLKVRNGRPGSWLVEWSAGAFRQADKRAFFTNTETEKRRTG